MINNFILWIKLCPSEARKAPAQMGNCFCKIVFVKINYLILISNDYNLQKQTNFLIEIVLLAALWFWRLNLNWFDFKYYVASYS